MTPTDHELLLIVREALLMLVDVLERKLELPRTKELRARLRVLEYEQKSAIISTTNFAIRRYRRTALLLSMKGI